MAHSHVYMFVLMGYSTKHYKLHPFLGKCLGLIMGLLMGNIKKYYY